MEIGIQWPLALFTLFAGAGCGLLVATGFAQLSTKPSKQTKRIALIGVVILLGIGGLMSVLHLSHPERFMAAVANLLSFSGISLELIGLALSGVAALLFLVFCSTENPRGEKVLAVCSIVIGVVAAFLHGFAYFEVVAQQGWHTLFLPLSYLFTSMTTGFLAYAALASFKSDDLPGSQLVGKVSIGLAAFATLFIACYVVALGAAGVLVGEALVIAVLALASELIALALAVYFVFRKSTFALAVGAALFGLGGGLAVRVVMFVVSTYGLNLIWEAAANRGLYL